MYKLAVFVSGSGSNMQAIINAVQSGEITKGKVAVVISNTEKAGALQKAENSGIKTAVVPKNEEAKLLALLQTEKIDAVVLAGYLPILPALIVENFPGRIINIHPSLIPKFCGKGFYGIKVHEAVIKAGEDTTGATVHYVDTGIDTGKIILQKTVNVAKADTPETLAAKVLEAEHEIIVQGVNILLDNM